MAEDPTKTSSEGSVNQRKPIKPIFVDDEIVNNDIIKFTGDEDKTIVVKAAVPHFISNYKVIDGTSTTGTSSEGNSGGTTKQETTQIDQNISIPLTDVIGGVNFTARDITDEMKEKREKKNPNKEKQDKDIEQK